MKLMGKWQQLKAVYRILIIVAIVVIIVVLLIAWGHYLHTRSWVWAPWTGFGAFTDPTDNYHRAKTLWDVMELLIVPAALALAVFLLNKLQKDREQEIAEQRAKTEREIAADRQQQITLETFLDQMAGLLLTEGLRKSRTGAEVRSVARARTLAVLRNLNSERKGQVLRFLYESGLIITPDPVIDLEGADLQKALLYVPVHFREIRSDGSGLTGWGLDLHKIHLCGASLSGAQLVGADLSEADLSKAQLFKAELWSVKLAGADLSKAALSDAILIGADLSNATLTNAMFYGADLERATVDLNQLKAFQVSDETTMPDGRKYQEWRESGEKLGV